MEFGYEYVKWAKGSSPACSLAISLRALGTILANIKGTTLLSRRRDRWKGNTETYLKEMACGGTDWIQLAQDTKQITAE
jgi:hypothetical protein